MPELLSIRDVATLLKISVPSIRRLQQQRQIPFIKIGGRVLFSKSDILSFVDRRRVGSID